MTGLLDLVSDRARPFVTGARRFRPAVPAAACEPRLRAAGRPPFAAALAFEELLGGIELPAAGGPVLLGVQTTRPDPYPDDAVDPERTLVPCACRADGLVRYWMDARGHVVERPDLEPLPTMEHASILHLVERLAREAVPAFPPPRFTVEALGADGPTVAAALAVPPAPEATDAFGRRWDGDALWVDERTHPNHWDRGLVRVGAATVADLRRALAALAGCRVRVAGEPTRAVQRRKREAWPSAAEWAARPADLRLRYAARGSEDGVVLVTGGVVEQVRWWDPGKPALRGWDTFDATGAVVRNGR